MISGTIESITDQIKNCPLCQKSAPSITQKSKNANKFHKIIHEILRKFLYIKNWLLKKNSYINANLLYSKLFLCKN